MIVDMEQLERLISRFLDGEATPDQQREMRVMLRRSADGRALFEEMSSLDREVGVAMRDALRANGRPVALRLRPMRFGWAAGLAAAACLAVLSWWKPLPWLGQSNNDNRIPRATFVPQIGDVYTPAPQTPSSYKYPRVNVKDTNTEYLMIPGDRPGEYLLLQVKRVQTQALPLHRDF